MAPLQGRHALITGAARGIGAAIARALAEDGATLTLLGRRREALQAPATTLPGAGHGVVVADVTDAAQTAAAWQELGARLAPLDVDDVRALAAARWPSSSPTPARPRARRSGARRWRCGSACSTST